MGALYTLALALAPRLVQHFVHRNGSHPVQAPSLRAADAQAPRHRALLCHWERADDGSLVAHWAHDEDEPSPGSPRPCRLGLLRGVPPELIDDAYHFERHGSVHALIAVSRMARIRVAWG